MAGDTDMGIAFSSIPGVGEISTWPQLGTFALIDRLYRIANYRTATTPRHRTAKRYIKVDTVNGSTTGGGGAGTEGDPFKVRHMADLKTLVASIIVSDQTIYLRNGDVFEAAAANSDQSIIISQASVSVCGWSDPASPSTVKPQLLGFRTVTGGVSGGGGVYDFAAASVRCYWARAKYTSTDYTGYRTIPYTKASSAANSSATTNSFYDDGATSVRVNVGDQDVATVQFAYVTSAGIYINNVDDVGLFDLVVEGFGLNVPGTAGGGQCIRSDAQGTNTHLISGCEMYWGPYHTGGQFVSNSGGNVAGGIVTLVDCKLGLFQWDGANGGDCWVGYNYFGGQECIKLRCQFTHAGLPATGITAIRGSSCKAHTNGPGSPIGLFLELDCNHVPTYSAFANVYITPDVPAITDKRLTTYYRAFVHNQTVAVTGSLSLSAHRAFISNRTCTITVTPPTGTYGEPHGAGGSANWIGLSINDRFTINLTGSWSKRVRYYNATSNHDFDQVHATVRITGSTPTGIDWQPGSYLQGCSQWNCITSNETGATDTNLTGSTEQFKEADPALGSGGLSAPAMWGMVAAQFNSCPSPVTLAAAASYANRSAIPAAILASTLALPSGLNCEYDAEMKPRSSNPLTRSRGAIEARPLGIVRGSRTRSRTSRRSALA